MECLAYNSCSSAVFSLHSQNLLCDVTIIAEDIEIAAHRVVLAACSPYFHAMFTGTTFFNCLLLYETPAVHSERQANYRE